MALDWSHRSDYMHQRHGVTVEQANEALADLRALVFDPDYASLSGHSVRTIGWSDTAGRLLTVITVTEDDVTYGSQRVGRLTTSTAGTTDTTEQATTMSSDDELGRLIAAEADHAEATRNDPIPPEALTHATRPNLARSVTFSLRLNPEELAEVQTVAGDRGIPASTLIRGWIVRQLAAERNTPSDTAMVVERLEADVRTLRKLVAS